MNVADGDQPNAEGIKDQDPRTVLEEMRIRLVSEDVTGLVQLLEPLSQTEKLRALLQLSANDRDKALTLLPPEFAAGLIDEAPSELAVDLVGRLETETAADIIEELDSDVQADVVGDLEPENAEAILAELDAEEAEDIRRLTSYDDDTAGGLMVSEIFTFAQDATVRDVLNRLSSEDEDFERFRGQHPYVLNSLGQPIGVISLRALLTSKRATLLSDIMVQPLSVSVNATLDDVRDIFDSHPFLAVPVTEFDGTLVGVVSRTAISEAVLERSESEGLKMAGVVGDEIRSMPLVLRSRRRLSWLSANIVLNVIAASVIAAYEETLTAVIAIAIFLPMVSDMSGCSGNQAVAVSMRELALGLIKPIDAWRVWYKESVVGVINGCALGILIGLVAWAWKDNAYLGLVIGLALALNTVVAVSIGGVVPLLLKRMGQDPAVASGPLLTTITDMMGFFLVLSLATLFMSELT